MEPLPLLLLISSLGAMVSETKKNDLDSLDIGLVDGRTRYLRNTDQCGGNDPCVLLPKGKCWGYEKGCAKKNRLSSPECSGEPQPWASTMDEKREKFWEQADFGYVKKYRDSMRTVCEGKGEGDTTLKCSSGIETCHATNLVIDFRKANFNAKEGERMATARLRDDFVEEGMLGGRCQFKKSAMNVKWKSHLQSWHSEVHRFAQLDFAADGSDCDVVVDRPTIFMKMDAMINMYHHFCDFVNLYATQHLNGSFSRDVQIVDWDATDVPSTDLFAQTWKAFSKHPIKRLHEYAGKRVCFRDAQFALLPRMIFGLFYNMPVVPQCSGSGLMRSFAHHVLRRLNIKGTKPETDLEARRIRVTLLSRGTRYRNILNEAEIIGALKTVGEFSVKRVHYNRDVPFVEQVRLSHNTDIFVGMHGAGLTHMLFLPDWGAVFEVYNTEDPQCYMDLANIRGLAYFTWENVRKLEQEHEGHHKIDSAKAKFTNYKFDVQEFMRIMLKIGVTVRKRRAKLQGDGTSN